MGPFSNRKIREKLRTQPGQIAACIAILAGWAALAYRFWFVCDDAWISFRFARNWAAGHGVRYNLGDQVPVEGYSNFLWVAIAAAFEALQASPSFWMPLVSGGCSFILLGATYWALRHDLGVNRQASLLACAALGWSPVFAVWTSGGLETMAATLCMFVCFESWVLTPERDIPLPGLRRGAGLEPAAHRRCVLGDCHGRYGTGPSLPSP